MEVLFASSGHRSRISDWKDLTISDLLTFISLTLLTGFIQLPHIEEEWKKPRLVLTYFHEMPTFL